MNLYQAERAAKDRRDMNGEFIFPDLMVIDLTDSTA